MAQQDLAPGLLEQIRKDFRTLLGDTTLSGSSYAAAEDYAEAVGNALAEAFRHNLTAGTLPDGKLYWNLADRVVRPMLAEEHALVADAAQTVQQQLNVQAGLGLKAQRAVLDEDRVDGILQKSSAAEKFEDAAWVLDEPVRTFSRMTVDDTLKANVDFQGKAGLRPQVIRTAESECCKWCSSLAGTYTYPDVPRDVYRRHNRCRCRVEYDPGSGRRQSVWTKEWTENDSERQERIWNIQNLSTEKEKSATMELNKSPLRQFSSGHVLQKHYDKHLHEFDGISRQAYLERANALADAPLSDDVVQLVRSDGSISKYCFSTNEFVVVTDDGNIRTFFKPEAREAYWDEELDRNK
ncbi:MAG: hypothetical protein ACI4JC_03785 [Faecalibacterium sp.]